MASTDRRRVRAGAAGLAAQFAVLAACSGSDTALVVGLTEQLSVVESSPLDDSAAARCVAEAVAEAIDFDLSVSLEATVFSDEELGIIGQAATTCADTDDVVIGVLRDLYAPEDASCIQEHVAETFSYRTIGAVVVGADPIAYEGFFEAVADTTIDCPGIDS